MKNTRLIWDLPVRLFHWSLVMLLCAMWYTAEYDNSLIELHIKLGYVTLGIVTFRILWGFVGTYHAKFINFLPSLSGIKAYLHGEKSYAGHNPLGGLMVYALLFFILLQAVTGLFISDDVFSAGPYYGVLSESLEKFVKFIHMNNFKLILLLVVFHIGAVFYYLRVKRINLITPMFTGKKQADDVAPDSAIKRSKLVVALVLAAAVAVFIYWLVVLNAPVVEEFYY